MGGLASLDSDVRGYISDIMYDPPSVQALRRALRDEWPDTCNIANPEDADAVSSAGDAYQDETFYMGFSDVALNKAALLYVIKKGPANVNVTNAEVVSSDWRGICEKHWFKCVFKPIQRICATALDGNMAPLCAMIMSKSLAELAELDLNENMIDDDGLTALATAIDSGFLANLTVLRLSENVIGENGMREFGPKAAKLQKLKELRLSVNQINDDASCHLLSNLPASLTHLDFRDNDIGNLGMIALANAIVNKPLLNLQVLDFERNKIGDPGMIALADAIVSKPLLKLKVLAFAKNKIGDPGMIALAKAISVGSLPVLPRAFMSDNPGSDVPIEEALAQRKQLP